MYRVTHKKVHPFFMIFYPNHMIIRGGQKSKKLESELADTFFPLHLMSGVTKKIFSSLPLIFPPPLAPYIIQRKLEKIQRKIVKVSIF